MTSVSIQNLSRHYGEVKAVDNVSIEIPDGALVCLLGPSGCGKTTLLRLIAGLEPLSAGEVAIDGVCQNDIPAHKREFGMVFQSLALFPHLSVADNIAYALKIRGVEAEARRARVDELLALVKLPDIADRRIHQLSGGQRQRVAIARGLAIAPRLFLLDEPLSALDAKLREHMQIELRLLQKQLNITTIVVTHDQREAMTMADLVIVMDQGRILQAGSPIEIYRRPANAFVADFIGMSNLLPCEIISGQEIELLGRKIQLPDALDNALKPGSKGILSIRPEDVVVMPDAGSEDITAQVTFVRDLGASVEILLNSGELEWLAVCAPQDRPALELGQTVGIKLHIERATVMVS